MQTRQRKRWFYVIPYTAWLVLFVVAPLALLVWQSMTTADGHVTWHNYADYLRSGTYLRMTVNSVIYAALVTFVTLAISYPAAYFLNRLRRKRFWLLLIILPTWINLLLKTYAFIGLFSRSGVINSGLMALGLPAQQLLFSDWSFLVVASYIELPFMILPIFNALSDADSRLEQASHDLGANQWQTLRHVVVPLSLPGVKAGIQAVFIPSLSLFMITRLIGGNRVITLGTAIEEHFLVTQNWQFGATIGVVLIAAMLVAMAITGKQRPLRTKRR